MSPHPSRSSSPSDVSDSPQDPGRSADSNGSSSKPDGTARKRRKVTRSRAGCLTCRKRRKLCDMRKPDCGACDRLRMECVWPAVRTLGEGSSEPAAFGSTSVSAPSRPLMPLPSSSSMSNIPLPNANNFRRGSFNSSSTAIDPAFLAQQHARPPQTELSAVDGLMNLFGGSDHAPNSHGYPMSFGTETPAIESKPPIVPISHPVQSAQPSNTLDGFGPDNLFNSDIFSFDDATLQLWAADCLPSLSGNAAHNPFDSLNDLLFPSSSNLTPPIPSPFGPTPTTSTFPTLLPPSNPVPNTAESHTAILSHYKDCLSRLVSCSGQTAPNAYDAFTSLANANISSPAGQGLHLSILAWAGRHMVNRGQANYEAVSERLGNQASQIILDKLDRENLTRMDGGELLTLFAGVIMLISFKICRGDVWGFDSYVDKMSRLSPLIFPEDPVHIDPNSTQFHFFENLVYHYIVSSSLLTRGPFMSDAALFAYSKPAIDSLHTLCGVNLQSFCIMHQIARLIRQRRAAKGVWADDALSDLVKEAERIEVDLEAERKRLDRLVQNKPHLASHRYFHEAFRIACLIQLRAFVLCDPPSSLNVRFLVRRSLSLLEAMSDQNLPGFCSAHWVIFTTAVCAAPGGATAGESDDQARAEKLYDITINSLGFLNTSRSRKIVRDVWSRNSNGQLLVDWVDILIEYDWEIMFT